MQSTENLQNTISSSMKEKVIISKTEQQPKSRVAAQEQVRILNEVTAPSKAQPQVPQSRGEVAAQEQVRILRQAMGM
jgi:hypothetical protein